MSVRLMGKVWELRVDHSTALVLLGLADHADDLGNRVYPSMGYLAWKTGLSERQVQRIVHRFRKQHVLNMVRQPGHHRPAEYRLDLSRLPKKPAYRDKSMGDTASPNGSAGVTSGAVMGDIQAVMGDLACHPNHQFESPNTESSGEGHKILSASKDDLPNDASPDVARQWVRARFSDRRLVREIPSVTPAEVERERRLVMTGKS